MENLGGGQVPYWVMQEMGGASMVWTVRICCVLIKWEQRESLKLVTSWGSFLPVIYCIFWGRQIQRHWLSACFPRSSPLVQLIRGTSSCYWHKPLNELVARLLPKLNIPSNITDFRIAMRTQQARVTFSCLPYHLSDKLTTANTYTGREI